MTDRDALIKELRGLNLSFEDDQAIVNKAIQALSAPGDAERDKLFNALSRIAEGSVLRHDSQVQRKTQWPMSRDEMQAIARAALNVSQPGVK